MGISLIGGFSYEKQGFRKDPYGFRNEFLVNYNLGRQSFMLIYNAYLEKSHWEQ
jgi:hypothetical protein